MSWVVRFAKSSIGAKMVMAISGVALFLFVLQHMFANLQMYLGPEVFNAYAFNIKSATWIVWPGRVGLIVMLIVHVVSSVRLTTLNRRARPEGYEDKRSVKASYASRTMMMSGLIVFGYLTYHLLHFTFGVTNPGDFNAVDPLDHHDAYRMVVLGFQNPLVSGVYIVSNLLVGLHLSHGASSMFQSLGIATPKYRKLWNGFGPAFAIVITLGFIAVPIGVLSGIIHL